MSSKKLYVGNLSYSTTDDKLRAAFETHGELVSANVVIDRDTGRSKGFGFVEYANDADAETAKEAMDTAEIDGRPIRVDFARERAPRPAGGYAGGPRGGYGGGSGYGGSSGGYGGGYGRR
jgi:cold-inducible RNA-binding protein